MKWSNPEKLKHFLQSRLSKRNRIALLIQRGHEMGWGATLTAEKILQELHQ